MLALYMYALCLIYFLDARRQGELVENLSEMLEALKSELNGKLTCRFTVIAQSWYVCTVMINISFQAEFCSRFKVQLRAF